jgi:exopolyphosphatase/guanosine-5'-triphosphate,3'-diphosphate pyrophosphatase
MRIAERFPELRGTTPGAPARDAAARARSDIARVVAPLAALAPIAQLRCVAGTPLTIAAVAYASHVDRVAGLTLPLTTIDATIDRLLALDLDARRALPGMLPQRADVLAAGGLILSESLRALAAGEAVLESNDLLLGYLAMTRPHG